MVLHKRVYYASHIPRGRFFVQFHLLSSKFSSNWSSKIHETRFAFISSLHGNRISAKNIWEQVRQKNEPNPRNAMGFCPQRSARRHHPSPRYENFPSWYRGKGFGRSCKSLHAFERVSERSQILSMGIKRIQCKQH